MIGIAGDRHGTTVADPEEHAAADRAVAAGRPDPVLRRAARDRGAEHRVVDVGVPVAPVVDTEHPLGGRDGRRQRAHRCPAWVPRQNEPGMFSGTTVTKNSHRATSSLVTASSSARTAGPASAATTGEHCRAPPRRGPPAEPAELEAHRAPPRLAAVACQPRPVRGGGAQADAEPESSEPRTSRQQGPGGDGGRPETDRREPRVPCRAARHDVQPGRGVHPGHADDRRHARDRRFDDGHGREYGVAAEQGDLTAQPRPAQVAQRLPGHRRPAQVEERAGEGGGREHRPDEAVRHRWPRLRSHRRRLG